jgi:hypothetical protein
LGVTYDVAYERKIVLAVVEIVPTAAGFSGVSWTTCSGIVPEKETAS